MTIQSRRFDRRTFLKLAAGGMAAANLPSILRASADAAPQTAVFSVTDIPADPFPIDIRPNAHVGIDALLRLLSRGGLKFYRTATAPTTLAGSRGLIAADDVVIIKVNAQWKYRGTTNSDLVRGLIQRILDHPLGFRGEIVMIENGQGRGSLNCDVTGSGYPDGGVQANAVDETQSFLRLVDRVFRDSRVSALLLDPYRNVFVGSDDHVTTGYRRYENVSYPCFTTGQGRRVELKEGIWTGNGYSQNLKLISVPVLKTHDGSEFTGAMKHFYGVLSMSDGQSGFRHYDGLGETCGKMVVSVRTPVLNILDAIWVSHNSLAGYPASETFNAGQIAASQDPLALDAWACRNILYAYDRYPSHNPDNAAITKWMTDAASIINGRGGLYNPGRCIFAGEATFREENMLVFQSRTFDPRRSGPKGTE